MTAIKTLKRVESKTLQGLFQVHLENNYKLPPMAAKTLSSDIKIWQDLFQPKSRGAGQIIYYAVKLGQPASKPIKDCELIPVKLTLMHDSDPSFQSENGLQALNIRIMERICREAVDQQAVLSTEDVSTIMRISEKTVQRYKEMITRSGNKIILRGDSADMGPASCHREAVIRLLIQGYSESEIALRTNHSLDCVESYIYDFLRVSLLFRDGYKPIVICRFTKLSKRKILEILALYKKFDESPDYSPALKTTLDIYKLERQFLKKGGSL